MIIENVPTLKIHKLTQAQYDRELAAGNLDENALYLTPDENVATDEEIVALLVQEDMLPAITDVNDSILSDKDGNILSW